MGALFTVILDCPRDGLTLLEKYESLILPLIPDHGGRLERRLRNVLGSPEIHIVWFPSHEAFQAYRQDPRRLEQEDLLRRSRAEVQLWEVEDVSETAPP